MTFGIGVYDFCAKIFGLKGDIPHWDPALLIIEILKYERLLNQMNIVKSNVRKQLTNSALDSLLRIKFSKVPINFFHKSRVSRCAKYWFKKKGRRIAQGKCDRYQCRKSKISKEPLKILASQPCHHPLYLKS